MKKILTYYDLENSRLEKCKFYDIHLTSKANSLTQGLWCIGGAVGAVISGPMAAKLGRKPTLLLNNFFVLSGAILQVRNDTLKNRRK